MPNPPTLFISGSHADGDQLALGHTVIDQSATDSGMTNVAPQETSGGHEDTETHMDEAYGAITTFLAQFPRPVVADVDSIL